MAFYFICTQFAPNYGLSVKICEPAYLVTKFNFTINSQSEFEINS